MEGREDMHGEFNGENKKVDKTDEAQSNRNMILASGCCAEASRSLKNHEILNTEEAADYLRLSRGSLLNMVCEGQIPVHKLGRRNRYLRSELLNMVLQSLSNKDKENQYGN